MGEEEWNEMLEKLDEGWNVVDGHHLKRKFEFEDFEGALEFVNQVGEVAEQEGHHPNISFTWGEAEIKIFTHEIDGLSDNDFILASKIDEITRS